MSGSLGRLNLNVIEHLPMEEGIQQLGSTATQAMMALQAMGIHPPSKPADNICELPSNITELDDNALGDLLGRTSQYAGFVAFKLAEADAARNAAKSLLEFVQARIRLTLRASTVEGGKFTNSDKDDIVKAHPQVVAAQKDYDYKQSVYDLVKQVMNNAQRNWDAVSRRITQRGQEVDRMRRVENVGGMGRVPMTPGAFRR